MTISEPLFHRMGRHGDELIVRRHHGLITMLIWDKGNGDTTHWSLSPDDAEELARVLTEWAEQQRTKEQP